MSALLANDMLPVNGSGEFAPSAVAPSAPKLSKDRTIPITYEVRSTDGNLIKTLKTSPAAARSVKGWKVAVNGVAIFLIVVVSGLASVGLAPMLWGWEPVIAESAGMEPAIRSSDIVLTAPADGSVLGAGTIVRYTVGDETRLGRIGAVTEQGYLIGTDAELNAETVAGTAPIPTEQIVGVGVAIVPWIGLPATWLSNASWIKLAGLAALAVAMLYVSRQRWVEPKSEWAFA